MTIRLIILSLIICLIYDSGFFEYIDEWLNGRHRFWHLPHLVMCKFCVTWWVCLAYVAVRDFTMTNVLLCLIAANLTDIYTPAVKMVKDAAYKIIETISRILKL